jgi:hypothetical protein
MTSRVLLFVLLVLAAGSARADWLVQAGPTRSDLGLNDKGDGFQVGVGQILPLAGERLDLSWSAEYLQRQGGQPMTFDDPNRGPVDGVAKVTLTYLQPTFFAGLRLPVGPVLPRLYGGLSVAIKLDETWAKPPGSTNRVYAYEDVALLVHAGATLGWRFLLVDVRWSWGLLEQVVDLDYDNAGGWNKAESPTGIAIPTDGDRISAVQAGLGVTF